jgi:hypothetical protein
MASANQPTEIAARHHLPDHGGEEHAAPVEHRGRPRSVPESGDGDHPRVMSQRYSVAANVSRGMRLRIDGFQGDSSTASLQRCCLALEAEFAQAPEPNSAQSASRARRFRPECGTSNPDQERQCGGAWHIEPGLYSAR